MQKEFDSELVNNGKFLETKIKYYGAESIHVFMMIKCSKRVLSVFVGNR